MLAAVKDYFASWHILVVLGLLLVWTVLGGLLLRRNVLPLVPRRKASANRCYLVAFLATLAATAGAAVVLMLSAEILHALLGYVAAVQWIAPLVAFLAFLLLTWVVLYASFDVPSAVTARLWLCSFGPPVALSVAIAIPVTIRSYRLRHQALDEQRSLRCLGAIYRGLLTYGGVTPSSLERLLKDNVLRDDELRCRRPTPRRIDFFYFPTDLENATHKKTRLLACDFVENHAGRGRCVLFADGSTRWCDPDEFARLLALEHNKAFALALRLAEKPPPTAAR